LLLIDALRRELAELVPTICAWGRYYRPRHVS